MAPNSSRIALPARHHPLACLVTTTGLIRTTTRIATGTPVTGSARLMVGMAMLDIIARLQSSRMASNCQSVKLIELRNNISLPYRHLPNASRNIKQPCIAFCRGAALLRPMSARFRMGFVVFRRLSFPLQCLVNVSSTTRRTVTDWTFLSLLRGK
jgi:hypothetical protein